MTIAAKHFDPQLGIDIHFYGIPLPVATLPLPTPHIGIVFDPFDYIPFIGSTVDVNGIKRATAGTGGLSLHIPLGPYSVEFLPAMPEGPQKDDELFMGSRTVEADGQPFSKLGMPVLDCNIVGMIPPIRLKRPSKPHMSMSLPTAVNLAVASNVFVGGPPTISLSAMAFRAGLSGLKALRRTKLWARASAAFKKLRQKLFKFLPSGFLKCKVLRAEPVDIRDGSVSVTHEDFAIPGRLPLAWTRVYGSNDERRGLCGHGWRTLADTRLEIDADGMVSFVDVAGLALFPALPTQNGAMHAVREFIDGARLIGESAHFVVQTKDSVRYLFRRPAPGANGAMELPIERIEDLCGNHWRFERADGCLVRIVERGIEADAASGEPALQGRFIQVQMHEGHIHQMDLHDPASGQSHVLVRYEVDALGDLVAAVDALGAARHFEYKQHHMLRHADRLGLNFFYGYNAKWQVVHAWGDDGLYDYRFRYDDLLNETEITDSLGHVSIVKFDDNGLPVCEIDPLDGVTVFEYDEFGHTTAVVDPEGLRTQFGYDERGNLLRLTRPDGSTLAMEYDDEDRPVAIIDADGARWSQAWDARGLLESQTTPLGAVSRYRYDPRGQLLEYVNAREAPTRLHYDRHGAIVQLADALGRVDRFEHDALGRLQARTDAAGKTTHYRYDAKGRLLGVALPGGDNVSCAYDAEDQLVRYIDEAGAETKLEYCGIGQLARRVQPDGHSVRYTYDSEEQLTGVVNQRGETYRLVRDPLGRIVEEIDYWEQARTYAYDAAGRLTRSTDPLGRSIAFESDRLGRITRKTLPDPRDPSRQINETFKYSRSGQLIELRNAASHVLRRFDADGRLIQETQNGFAIGHAYDALGNRIERRSAAGNIVAVEYDLANQPVRIAINDAPPVRIERNALGQAVVEQLSPALQRTLRYDDNGLLTAQAVSCDHVPLFDTRYDYDKAGNLVRRGDSAYGSDTYAYDPMGRVLEHVDPAGKLTRWLNDPTGDRLQTRIREVRLKQAVGGAPLADEWTREGDYDGHHYVFDRAGNLVRREHFAEPGHPSLHLAWDANQRLAESHWQGGERDGQHTTYGYDPLGRRVYKRNPTHTTWFFWDGDALLAEVAQPTADTDLTREPRNAGNIIDLFAARKRLEVLEALHPQAREYVYKPGTFEPLALIEGKNKPAVVQADTSGTAKISEATSQATDTSITPIATTPADDNARVARMIESSAPKPAVANTPNTTATKKNTTGTPITGNGQGLGMGLGLGQNNSALVPPPEPVSTAQDHVENPATLEQPLGMGMKLGNSATPQTAKPALKPIATAVQPPPSKSTPPATPLPNITASISTNHPIAPAIKPPQLAREAAIPVIAYYHNDPNGCPARVTDCEGKVLWAATHTAWGAIAKNYTALLENPIRLQGQYEDAESGLHYNRHRYYDAVSGLYIAQDPIGLDAGSDLYYFAPNTARWIDPLGLTLRPGGAQTHDVGDHSELSPGINRAPGHTNTARDLRVQSHHPVQDAWARANIPNYNSGDAPTILLRSASGYEHAQVSAAQRSWRAHLATLPGGKWGSTTLRDEMNAGYRQLIDAGVPKSRAQRAINKSYAYFKSLGCRI